MTGSLFCISTADGGKGMGMGMPEHSGWHDNSFPEVWMPQGKAGNFGHGAKYEARLDTMQIQDVSKDVLVVDDDPHLCDIITDVLEAEGHTTRTASNGEEALERIRERKPQLVLLDLMMPVMNGWELAEALRDNPDWADIPIVFVTAAHSAMHSKPQDMGAKAIISKPFDIDALAEAVHTYAT